MANSREIDPTAVDAVMGKGWWAGYSKVAEEDFLNEQARSLTNIERYSSFWNSHTKNLLEQDLAIAEATADAITANLIDISVLGSRNQLALAKVKQPLVDGMYAVLEAALKVLTIENWTLDDLHSYKVVTIVSTISLAQIREKAAAALKSLTAIETELKKAKKQATEAKIQLAINASLAILTPLIIPGGAIAILAAMPMALGQIVLDDNMGVQTSWYSDYASKGTNLSGGYASATFEVMQTEARSFNAPLTKGAARVGKAAKGLPFIGLAFDANEILVAGQNVTILQAQFDKALADWQALVQKVDLYDEKFADLKQKIRLAREQTKKRGLPEIQTARDELAAVIKSTGFNPLK